MKQQWSGKWVKSKQPRKQRKYRYNAPLHLRHKFLSVTLTKTLRSRFGVRSMPLRTGDEVEVMRGSLSGQRGKVEKVHLRKGKVYIENLKVKKVDGSQVARPLQPSNLRITALSLDDKKRLKILERRSKKKIQLEAPQPANITTKEKTEPAAKQTEIKKEDK